ncbi:MAG: caspase family protein [Spirosomataceae bacterium]
MKTPWFSVPKLRATLWLLFISLSTQAQTQHALLIGISHYQELDTLQFADRDAVAFAEFLKSQQVPEDNIKLFLNENATRFNIVDELYNTTQSLKKGDRFYFYFGGHGDLEAKIGYENSLLLLYNSFKKNYFQGNEYLQLSELKTWFRELSKKGIEVIFIADACHSGGLIGGKEGNSKTQKALQESWEGITKILSSKADEFSLEGKQWGGGRGLFSYHLVNGLIGRADGNGDQKVSLGELSKYLQEKVVGEAAPNVQTPVVLGNSKQQVSVVSKAAMKGLAEAEKRQIPILTEVNIKGGEEREALLNSRLDTTLSSTYRKFIQALKTKRINTYDDSTDYALMHFRTLEARRVPENLLKMMKRNLGAALMEKELQVMKNLRETGSTLSRLSEAKTLLPATANLREAINLLGTDHYIYPYLKARTLILEAEMSQPKPLSIPTSQQIDMKEAAQVSYSSDGKTKQIITKEEARKNVVKKRQLMLESLALEPNMVSTYALLASSYRVDLMDKKNDSTIYFLDKVTELLPNSGYTYFNLGYTYDLIPFNDREGVPIPHPKLTIYPNPQALSNYEKALSVGGLDVYTQKRACFFLGYLYRGKSAQSSFRDYAKAINYVEKLATFEKQANDSLKVGGKAKYVERFSTSAAAQIPLDQLLINYSLLYQLHRANNTLAEAEAYLSKITQETKELGLAVGFRTAAFQLHELLKWDENADYLQKSLSFQLLALEQAEKELAASSVQDKPRNSLRHREQILAVGALYRALGNYEAAEKYLLEAANYPLADEFREKWRVASWALRPYQNRLIGIPVLARRFTHEVKYGLEVNLELFFLKLEQNKQDEAFGWLEKAIQVPRSEDFPVHRWFPNFEKNVFQAYSNLDVTQFKTLKAKYFPVNDKK